MGKKENRRKFLKTSLLATAGAAALSFEEKALLAKSTENAMPVAPKDSRKGLPTGKIGSLRVSRLICGGNLISGFAHSRDLIYVSPLLTHYFTDEKVLDTLELCEERGINTAILRVDKDTIRIVNKYRNERGGKIQWIAQVKPTERDLESDVRRCVENSAVAAYIHGGVGDRWVSSGKTALAAKVLEIIRKYKVPAGLAGHAIETIQGYEKAKLEPDFYMKTLNSKSYWSAGPKPRLDSVWAETPEETIKFMAEVNKPWIAYKVLGAGAIHPNEGFQYAYENGADFLCVGMFDFQIAEDVIIAKKTLSKLATRKRPWRG